VEARCITLTIFAKVLGRDERAVVVRKASAYVRAQLPRHAYQHVKCPVLLATHIDVSVHLLLVKHYVREQGTMLW
jgi:hypothetical protein